MFEIPGKYNKAKIYATTVDSSLYAQVLKMCNTEKLKNSRIAMMPDARSRRLYRRDVPDHRRIRESRLCGR